MAKLYDILEGLDKTSSLLTLAIPVAGTLKALISGIALAVKKIKTNADGTVEYAVIIQSAQADLDVAATDFQEALDLVNSELQRMGLPPLDQPVTPTG